MQMTKSEASIFPALGINADDKKWGYIIFYALSINADDKKWG